MDTNDILALYDRQQRINLEEPGARREVLPQLVRHVRTTPGWNFISYSRLDPATAAAAIQEQLDYFRPLGRRVGWRTLGHDQPSNLRPELTAHGFVADEPGALLALELEQAPPALLQPVRADLRPIRQRAELEPAIGVMTQVWGRSFEWMRQRIGDHLALPGYLELFVAYLGDEPACAGWIYFYPGSQFAGLYGGSTVPAHRKRGLYTALLAARAQRARARGYRFLTVDASPQSRPIVNRHGFRQLTDSLDFAWEVPES